MKELYRLQDNKDYHNIFIFDKKEPWKPIMFQLDLNEIKEIEGFDSRCEIYEDILYYSKITEFEGNTLKQ